MLVYVGVGNEEAKEGHRDLLVILKYHFHHLSTKKPLVTFGCLEDRVQSQNQSWRSLYHQAFPHLSPNEYWSLRSPQNWSALHVPETAWLFSPLHFHSCLFPCLGRISISEFISSLWLFCLLLSTLGILEKKGYSLMLLYEENNWLVRGGYRAEPPQTMKIMTAVSLVDESCNLCIKLPSGSRCNPQLLSVWSRFLIQSHIHILINGKFLGSGRLLLKIPAF